MDKTPKTLSKSLYATLGVAFFSIVLAALFPHGMLGNLGAFILFLSAACLFGFSMFAGLAAVIWAIYPDTIYQEQFIDKGEEYKWDQIVEWQSKPVRGYWGLAFLTLCTAALGWYWYATIFLVSTAVYLIATKSIKKTICDLNEKLKNPKPDPLFDDEIARAAEDMAREFVKKTKPKRD